MFSLCEFCEVYLSAFLVVNCVFIFEFITASSTLRFFWCFILFHILKYDLFSIRFGFFGKGGWYEGVCGCAHTDEHGGQRSVSLSILICS